MGALKKYIQDQHFNPGLLGLFINPFFIVRKELRRAMMDFSGHVSGRVLDVGCGHRPYEQIFSKAAEYIGLEYDSPENRKRFKKIDAWYDGLHLPFKDDEFDALIATQVLEHVFNPDVFVGELRRVLRPGGTLLLTAPFVWDEHEQPYDYARYSSFGLTHLMKQHGFEVVEHKKNINDIRVIFQLINCYIHKQLKWLKYYPARMIAFSLLTAPFTIIGTILSWILPTNNDLYMDNVVVFSRRE